MALGRSQKRSRHSRCRRLPIYQVQPARTDMPDGADTADSRTPKIFPIKINDLTTGTDRALEKASFTRPDHDPRYILPRRRTVRPSGPAPQATRAAARWRGHRHRRRHRCRCRLAQQRAFRQQQPPAHRRGHARHPDPRRGRHGPRRRRHQPDPVFDHGSDRDIEGQGRRHGEKGRHPGRAGVA